MKNQKLLFNNWLRAYIKCMHKLTNLRLANRNFRRQGILEKKLAQLYKKLLSLQTLFKRATVATVVVGAMATTPLPSTAQTFAAFEINPFGLVRLEYLHVPDFTDLDGDGDLDIMTGGDHGAFIYYENTGTVSTPEFAAPVSNPFGLTNTENINAPDFADLDGDGDLDIITGSYDGEFIYVENTGTNTDPAFDVLSYNPFGLDTIEKMDFPTFADIDGDGDYDIMAGGNEGIFLFLKNMGTASLPHFDAPQTNPFGLSSTEYLNIPAFADLDNDGDLDIMTTEYYGPFIYFMNTGTAAAPSYAPPQIDPFELVSTGNFSFITFGDLDGDGDADLLTADYYGFYDGNFLYFQNTTSVDEDLDGYYGSTDCDDTNPEIHPLGIEIPNNGIDEDCDGVDLITQTHDIADKKMTIYPNPVSETLFVTTDLSTELLISIFDLTGQLMHTQSGTNEIDVSTFPEGLYFIKASSPTHQLNVVEKIVVVR